MSSRVNSGASFGSVNFLAATWRALNWLTWMRFFGGLWLLSVGLNAGRALAADRITLSYGLLERSISVSSLETYAAGGRADGNLKTFIHSLNAAQRSQLRSALQTQADLTPVAVSQFLYSDQGEIFLRRFGEVIRTESNLSGFYALRSALILAAANPDGLSLMNVLEEFPLDSIRVDLSRALQIWSNLEKLIHQTQQATALVEHQSVLEEGAAPPASFAGLPDLRLPGTFTWKKQTIQLSDRSRNRNFPADIYLPQSKNRQPVLDAPVIVISHGLGSDRTSYAYLARQLASYGFAVAVPEHPGSNSAQLQALISGRASQVTKPSEFINRPLDIKYLLDTLEALSKSDPTYTGRLNLQQVGVIGQSMGGYTALALAGAKINFRQLTADCTLDTLNISLLLQCRALELPKPAPDFRDSRVKAVIAVNPIGSSLLGKADYAAIHIPVMLVGGSADTIAPVLLEQILPFTWLGSANKYFVLLQKGTHFSTIGVSDSDPTDVVELPPSVIGPDPKLAYTYLKAVSIAFFGTYVADQTHYARYLEAGYAKAISRSELPISLVRSLASTQLANLFDKTKPLKSSATELNSTF